MANKIVKVYIGRFQPLHKGHCEVLNKALASSDLTIVLIGSSHQARTVKNPFTYDERRSMIEQYVTSTGRNYRAELVFVALRDQPYNNAKWIQSVQEEVEAAVKRSFGNTTHKIDIQITGSDRDESCWYLHAFPQWEQDLKAAVPEGEDLSATKLRKHLFTNDGLNNPAWKDAPATTISFLQQFVASETWKTLKEEYDFLEDYKARHKFVGAKYDASYQTADAVIIQSGHILVTVRGHLPGKGLWALPGGFVKPHQTKKAAAIAETIEETGLRLAEGKRWKEITEQILEGSIRAKEEFDDPNRSLRGRTFTTAFLFRLDDTKPLPHVSGQFAPLEDTDGVEGIVETLDSFWLPIHIARRDSHRWFEDHHSIVDWGVSQIKD
jgi:bifunctional NMN adenylyltransferase/nudix hydrolase